MFDADKSNSIDVVEFGDVLSSTWRKIDRQELDAIFRVIDRNNRGFLTEQDLRNAFANKEAALVDVPFINANDLLLPLFTKAHNVDHIPNSRLWSKFSREGKMQVEELCNLLVWVLQIEPILSEQLVLKTYISDYGSGSALKEADFNKLMNQANFIRLDNTTHEGVVSNAMLKLGAALSRNGRKLDLEIQQFMTWDEKERKVINRRNLKHFLSINANLSVFELQAVVTSFDTDNDGFIEIEHIKNRYPQDNDIRNFIKRI